MLLILLDNCEIFVCHLWRSYEVQSKIFYPN